MHRRVFAFIGSTGSGKTTIIERMVQHYTERGDRVGVIKHTHHPLNRENRGDTARFLGAGACVAILADDREAVVFLPDSAPSSRAYADVHELIAALEAEVVLVEGFKAEMKRGDVQLAGLVEFSR